MLPWFNNPAFYSLSRPHRHPNLWFHLPPDAAVVASHAGKALEWRQSWIEGAWEESKMAPTKTDRHQLTFDSYMYIYICIYIYFYIHTLEVKLGCIYLHWVQIPSLGLTKRSLAQGSLNGTHSASWKSIVLCLDSFPFLAPFKSIILHVSIFFGGIWKSFPLRVASTRCFSFFQRSFGYILSQKCWQPSTGMTVWADSSG